MIKRTIKETVREYDADGKVVRETVTEGQPKMTTPCTSHRSKPTKKRLSLGGVSRLVLAKQIAKEDTMQRVGEFEKVSFEQFRDAMKDGIL